MMKNISTLKINRLVENLYLEGVVNKLYEDMDDFQWIRDEKIVDPYLPFKEGYEYFIDVTKLSTTEKMEIYNFLLDNDIVSHTNSSYFSKSLDDGVKYRGIMVHCAGDDNNFNPKERELCFATESYDESLKNLHDALDAVGNTENVTSEYVDGEIYLNNIRTVKATSLNESFFNSLGGSIKTLIKDVVGEYGLASKFITTFGTGISAFYGPISRLLEGSGISLDKKDIVLLIITAITFMLNDTDFNKLKEIVKQKGLGKHVKSITNFINSSKKLIDSVTKKVKGTIYGLSDILGFTFILVPVMDMLTQLIENYGLTIESIIGFIGGLSGAALAYSVKSIVKRIGDKF